jgi:hypothetical protein
VLSPFIVFPVSQHSPIAALDDRGLGLYGRAPSPSPASSTSSSASASIASTRKPTCRPPSFHRLRPFSRSSRRRISRTCRHNSPSPTASPGGDRLRTATRGFKAGGFNAASPAGAEAYDQEHSWNYEGGVKTSAYGGRLSASLAAFRIDWDDLQVNVPNRSCRRSSSSPTPRRDNTASSRAGARPATGVELFGGFGVTDAPSGRQHVERHRRRRQQARERAGHTADLGVQYSRQVWSAASLTLRGEVVRYGEYQYDDATRWRRRRIRSRTSAPACAASGCSAKRGSATRSTRTTFRSRSRSRGWRRRGSWARTARRGRSGSASGLHLSGDSHATRRSTRNPLNARKLDFLLVLIRVDVVFCELCRFRV